MSLRERYESDLIVRVGRMEEVVRGVLREMAGGVWGVWIAGAGGTEEEEDERKVEGVVRRIKGVQYRRWEDGSYLYTRYVQRDGVKREIWARLMEGAGISKELGFDPNTKLPDVFTTFRKLMEPLRETIPLALPVPESLPPLPERILGQEGPFSIPESLPALISALQHPLLADPPFGLPAIPTPCHSTAHPFLGGETHALSRLHHLILSGAVTTYKLTRNSLLGLDASTKLSSYLAQGCLTSRQIHTSLLTLENALSPALSSTPGYGLGETPNGTGWLRFELCWRDYFALCSIRYASALFKPGGFRSLAPWWPPQTSPEAVEQTRRWCTGTTGTGLVDASMRELYQTGFTSNRARQNAGSFLGKRLRSVDWRVGAEWYEYLLVDYDPASNWGNWQYVAGVGNDPRGAGRVFNQIKQAGDYDNGGEYVKAWVRELGGLEGGRWKGTWMLEVGEKEEVLRKIKEAGGGEDERIMLERPLVILESRRGGGSGGQKGGRGGGGGGGRRGGGGRHGGGDEAERGGEGVGRGRGGGTGGGNGNGRGRGRGKWRGRGNWEDSRRCANSEYNGPWVDEGQGERW